MLGIIVIFVLSWLTLTAYMLLREPKFMEHWKYSNLGVIGVITLFGITSFLAVSVFILFIPMQLFPNLLPALVLSDESVYVNFFTYAFFTQMYMLLILFYGKLPGKIPDSRIVPTVVAKVIKLNFSALWIIPLAGILLFAIRQGEWVILLLIVGFIIGCLFSGACLRTVIEFIRKPTKRTKANLKFNSMKKQILWMLLLLLSLPVVYFTDRTNWALYGLCAVGISWTAPGFLPKNARSFLERRFFNDTVKRTVFVLVIPVVSLLAYYATDWLNGWIYVGVGVILEAFIVFCIFRQKELEELIKRNESRIPKWLRRRLKLI